MISISPMTPVPCTVRGVFIVENPSGTVPVVVLSDDSGRLLPIFVGLWEAVSIKSAINKEVLPRPFTHDLFLETLGKFGIMIQSLQIDTLLDGVYYAQLVLSSSTKEVKVDCRPSDGIALAIRGNAPIYAEESVLQCGGQHENDLPPMTDLAVFLQK